MNQTNASAGISRTAMESLASEFGVPIESVERACRKEAETIGANARIQNFVPVLVTSRVRRQLVSGHR